MVWNGTKPTATQSTLKEGSGGALGAGGKLQGSSINPAPDGTAGDAAKEFEQK